MGNKRSVVNHTEYIEDVDDLTEYGYNDKDARKVLYLEPNESYIVVDEDMSCKCIQRIKRIKKKETIWQTGVIHILKQQELKVK